MNGIENAQHDLRDATLSIETAIDLLSSLEQEEYSASRELTEVIRSLREVHGGLERSFVTLDRVNGARH